MVSSWGPWSYTLASLSIDMGRRSHQPWSAQAPLLPPLGQSVVPEPKDEVEACEGRSAHLPQWAGPRGWGLCSLSKFRVRFFVEEK